MELLSLSAFAATHGASKQAAAKWKARGVLVFSGAQVDVAASDKKMRGAGLGRFKVNRLPDRKATTGRSPVVGKDRATTPGPSGEGGAAEIDGVDDAALDLFAEQLLSGKFATLVDANRVKENALALKHLIAARKDAGAVIETELAEAVVFEVTRGARNAWMSWPGQIAPLLAADLGIEAERVLEALTPYVQQHLEQLGEPAVDFNVGRES